MRLNHLVGQRRCQTALPAPLSGRFGSTLRRLAYEPDHSQRIAQRVSRPRRLQRNGAAARVPAENARGLAVGVTDVDDRYTGGNVLEQLGWRGAQAEWLAVHEVAGHERRGARHQRVSQGGTQIPSAREYRQGLGAPTRHAPQRERLLRNGAAGSRGPADPVSSSADHSVSKLSRPG